MMLSFSLLHVLGCYIVDSLLSSCSIPLPLICLLVLRFTARPGLFLDYCDLHNSMWTTNLWVIGITISLAAADLVTYCLLIS